MGLMIHQELELGAKIVDKHKNKKKFADSVTDSLDKMHS